MNPQKNQGEATLPLLRDLQAEVSTESAPLLQFILRHAGLIAGVVVLFLLVLIGTGIWSWHAGNKNEEAREELARTELTLQGKERTAALKALAARMPDAVRVPALLAWAQSALADDDPTAAAEAYSAVAAADADGALGKAAGLGQAASLLKAGKSVEALSLLQNIEARLPENSRSLELRQMVAEAAAAAGHNDMAARVYLALARDSQGVEKDYFNARAMALTPSAAKEQEQSAQP